MKKISLFLASGLMAMGLYAQQSVTFQVDMKTQTVSPNGVHVAGNFQSEANFPSDWDPATTALADGDGDGVYTLTVTLPDGNYEYKFVNGNAWGSDEGVPGACAVNGNRGLTVAGAAVTTPLVCFASCDPCPAGPVDTLNVTLKVNMSNFITMYGNTFSMVSVTGDYAGAAATASGQTWTNWTPGQMVMTDTDGDNIYEISFRCPEGTFAYKYIAGDAWGKDELLTGGNREMVIAGAQNDNVTFGPFCFGDKTGDCAALGATRNVTIRVDMNNEVYDADSVYINGTIKFPADTKTQMTDADGDGIFEATLALPTGVTYGMKFFNNAAGEPGDDLGANGCGLGDFGKNRKMFLPSTTAADTTLPCFAFNSCTFSCAGFHTALEGPATEFSVAPNPFTNRTVISFNQAGVYNVALISVAGQVVRNINDVRANSVEISREGLNAGLYLLSVTNESGVRTIEKVVIE